MARLGNPDDGVVYIEVRVSAISERAVRCQPRGLPAGWVPLSLVHDDSEVHGKSKVGDKGRLALPEWKAEEMGWA